MSGYLAVDPIGQSPCGDWNRNLSQFRVWIYTCAFVMNFYNLRPSSSSLLYIHDAYKQQADKGWKSQPCGFQFIESTEIPLSDCLAARKTMPRPIAEHRL